MQTWRDYARRIAEGPARYDIALLNLLCAAGLRGAEWMDMDLCLRTIDKWAEGVRYYTSKLYRHFKKKPGKYHHSQAFFRAASLITILQRDFGVRHNPAKEPEDTTFEPADSFLFGIVQGNGGTCATMPVLYVAVGRRLGYPLRLVEAKGAHARHLFVRWDDPLGPCFNIEATGPGMSCLSDDHYRQGMYAIDRQTEHMGEFLQSKTPKQELAGFLAQRHYHLEKQGQLREATDIIATSCALAPKNDYYWACLSYTMTNWHRRLYAMIPAGFPHNMDFEYPHRRFADHFPIEAEKRIRWLEAVDDLLNNKELDREWWEPMRKGRWRSEQQLRVLVRCDHSTGERRLQVEVPKRNRFQYSYDDQLLSEHRSFDPCLIPALGGGLKTL